MTASIVLLATALQVEAPFGKYEIQVPEFGAREFSVAEYGAKSNGAKCTEAIAAAMVACEKAGGGKVVVPSGCVQGWTDAP